MPDITLPPVLVDTSLQESGQNTTNHRNPFYSGPFVVGAGSNLYLVLQTANWPPGPFVNVFKSTDHGASWTQMDAAHSPLMTDNNCRVQALLNPDGRTLTIAFNPNSAISPVTLSWITFDTTTDKFGTPGTIPDFTLNDANGGKGLFDFDFVVRVNGDIVLMFDKVVAPNTTQSSCGYVIGSGGAWSAYTVTAAGDEATHVTFSLPAVVLDEVSGLIHWFLTKTTSSGGLAINDYYLNLSPGNVASVPFALSARVGPSNDRPAYGRPIVSHAQNAVVMPVFNYHQPGYTALFYYGANLAAPVFTANNLESSPTVIFGTIDLELAHLMVVGNDIWALWAHEPDTNTIQIHRSICTAGVFAPVAVFYDLFTNPPNSLPPNQQFMFGVMGAKIGSVGAVISASDALNNFNPAYFLLQAVAPPPPVLTLTFKGYKVYPRQ